MSGLLDNVLGTFDPEVEGETLQHNDLEMAVSDMLVNDVSVMITP